MVYRVMVGWRRNGFWVAGGIVVYGEEFPGNWRVGVSVSGCIRVGFGTGCVGYGISCGYCSSYYDYGFCGMVSAISVIAVVIWLRSMIILWDLGGVVGEYGFIF